MSETSFKSRNKHVKLVQLPNGNWIDPRFVFGVVLTDDEKWKATNSKVTYTVSISYYFDPDAGKYDNINRSAWVGFDDRDEARRFRDEFAETINWYHANGAVT